MWRKIPPPSLTRLIIRCTWTPCPSRVPWCPRQIRCSTCAGGRTRGLRIPWWEGGRSLLCERGGEKTKKWWGRQYTSICKEKTAIKVWLGPLVEKNPLQCHESYLFCHLLQNHTQKPYSERTGRHIWLVGRFVQNRTWCHPAQRDDPAHGVTDTNTLEATKQLLDPATRVQARRPSHRQNWHQQVDKWSGTCP